MLEKSYGFITDYEEFIFFTAERLENQILFSETALINQQDGFELLIRATFTPFDLKIPQIPPIVVPEMHLSRGATAHVFSCIYRRTEKSVLKVVDLSQQGVPQGVCCAD